MSVAQACLGVLLLVTSGIAFPQVNNPRERNQSANVAPEDQRSASPNIDPCQTRGWGGIQVLTDTMGVDFGPYVAGVSKAVYQSWYELIPPSAYPPIRKQGKVAIEFLINKDGKVKSVKTQTSSSDVSLDRAAWASISGSKFAALPAAFPGQQIRLLFDFYYNLEKSSISVSPCVDVKVPAGDSTILRLTKGNHR